ncbi:MAG: flagellar M-ring protein FliF [Epulopiscium sp. Nele67-Bin004]|nr:MAG: flagellar M-ring protein FliF [Epulopiscium sp. Nele67-Bin004]
MEETVTQVSNQLTQRWNDLPKKQKIQIGVGVASLLIAIVVMVFMFSRPQTSVLYRNLDLTAAAEVVDALDSYGIAYNLLDGGTTIELQNSDDLSRTKIMLASEQVPNGNYTFADSIDNSMTTTESEKSAKEAYYELVRLEETLGAMSGINSATVSLNIPEAKNSFLASDLVSTASVMLDVRNTLSNEQIVAVARYMANSVNNLDMSNITIVDTNGNLLYNGETDNEFVATGQQQLKLAAEADIKSKIYSLLSPIYDEITISSNLILEFDQYQETREEYYSPIEGSSAGLIYQQHTTAAESSSLSDDGDTVGVDANIDEVPGYVTGETTSFESSTETADTYYHTNRVVSSASNSTGTIDYAASSVAVYVFRNVIYDESVLKDTLPDGMSWTEYKIANANPVAIDVDQATLDAVRTGSGINNVVVYGYEKPVFRDEPVYEINLSDYIPFILLLALGIIVVLVLFRFRKQEEVVEVEEELATETVLETIAEEVMEPTTEEEEEELEDIELREMLETKRRIEKFVDEKPEAVASLLRNWLEEDWED